MDTTSFDDFLNIHNANQKTSKASIEASNFQEDCKKQIINLIEDIKCIFMVFSNNSFSTPNIWVKKEEKYTFDYGQVFQAAQGEANWTKDVRAALRPLKRIRCSAGTSKGIMDATAGICTPLPAERTMETTRRA